MPRRRRTDPDRAPPPDPTPDPRLITDPATARALYDEIREARIFALDTEFISEHTYRPELAPRPGRHARPRRHPRPPSRCPAFDPLWELVADPDVEVVMHAGDQESRFCWLETGALPDRVFDVQIAAGLLGHRYPLAYHSLVGAVLRRRAEQGQTRSDWIRRPLSDRQLAYAAADVDHLLPLRDVLHPQLDAREPSPLARRRARLP